MSEIKDEEAFEIWEEYPNPRSMDRDDLLEALTSCNPLDYDAGERDELYLWYKQIPEDVRDDAALNMPHRVMLFEVCAYNDLKGVHRRVIQRNAEVRHLKREIAALEKTNEQLRGTIRLMAFRLQVEKGAIKDDD